MRKSRTCLFYLFISSLLSTYIGYLTLRDNHNVRLFQREFQQFLKDVVLDDRNDFLSVDPSIYNDLLINTSNCKIPNFNVYDEMAVPFVHKAEWVEDCRKINYAWTYRERNEIVFNITAMQENGYKFRDVKCCYKIITRIEQTLENYDKDVENLIQYSECMEIFKERTEFSKPDQEFVMIQCTGNLPGFILYRGFHGLAQSLRSNSTMDKIRYWKNVNYARKLHKRQEGIQEDEVVAPQNIVIIGTDTTSRLNFRRNMMQAQRKLEKLGAIEMKGYMKSGSNTHPAMVTWFTGYTTEEVSKTCASKEGSTYDNCPIIWNRFNQSKYLTAYSEDWPDLYPLKFVHQHVDYYLRTLENAAHDYGLPFPVNQFARLSTQWCIGHQTNDELLTDYTEAVLDMAQEQETPLFAMIWSDTYPHSKDHNLLQLLDETYANFLKRIEEKGHLENTILIFLSDHGQRYGPLRETLIGWYEDRLPNMWILLPKRIQQQHPEWQIALETNAHRISSPYTLYWTLNFLLDKLQPDIDAELRADFTIPPPQEAKYFPHTEEVLPRQFTQQHFFTEIPQENVCADVGVPQVYCACNPLKKIELDNPKLLEAADVAMQQFNSNLHAKCANLKVGRINGGATIEHLGSSVVTYIIGIVSQPGEMLLEIQIDHFSDTQVYSNSSDVQRSNQINPNHIKCLDQDVPGEKKFMQFCYCQS